MKIFLRIVIHFVLSDDWEIEKIRVDKKEL